MNYSLDLNKYAALARRTAAEGCVLLENREGALPLKKGVKVTGATVHLVNEQYDDGRILLQKAVSVEEGDTPETLQKRVMKEAEWVILPKALDMITRGE